MLLPALPPLPFLSPNFGSHMVLQRDKPNTFWGWTTPGETVTVSVGGRNAKGKAGPDGRWLARLTPPQAGGPYKVSIEGSEAHKVAEISGIPVSRVPHIELTDVL